MCSVGNFPQMIPILALFLLVVVAKEDSHIREDLTKHPNWKLLSPYQEECGESVADRIIGGVNATLGQYPWLARLGYAYTNWDMFPDTYDCGGAIINEIYILTASHCGPETIGMKLLQVQLGEYYTETDPDCVDGICAPPVQNIDVESYVCHENYNSANFDNDICLIRLAEPIKFNDFVQPICLPIYDTLLTSSHENEIMEVAGWGIYDLAIDDINKILQTVKVPVTNHQKCKKEYEEDVELHATQFCAGGIIGKDSCMGDSGGPLMKPFAFNGPPKYFILGIVSFGPKLCAKTNSPGVYIKVASYMKWILDNIDP